ncbi:ABC transporter ATP-binding protein [Paenibacillus arenilitoris]|nr:ABC transporter ATP-binding protein [Paenibacillus arenilitoris]
MKLVPYLAVYFIIAELLRHDQDMASIDGGYVIRWAVWGVTGMVLGYVLMYFGGMCSHIAAFRILYQIRVKLSDHLGRLPLGFFSKNATGKLKKNMEMDVERIELFIAHQLPDLISTAAMIAAMFIVMLCLNVWLALACIIPIVIGFTVQYSMMAGDKAKRGMREYFDSLENINSSAIQYVRGMPAIKMFGQTVHSFRQFHEDIVRYRDFSLKYADHFQNGYVSYKVIVLSLATFVLPAGLFILSRDPDNMAFARTLMFFLVLVPGVASPIFKLNSFASALNVIVEGVRRIDDILEQEAIAEPDDNERPSSYDVQFHGVGFSYGGTNGVPVLHHMSLTARQGEITALVGPSGSGKSTVAQLIPRFWDVQTGSITIGGVDIRRMKTSELMDTMSFVFQETFLFSDTVYNNIAAGNPAVSWEDVLAAARAAQCHSFIERLPDGYDTRVGEGGVYLSGGEEQRISVARAILKNAPILVLDEATAYSDPENEYQMQLALGELMKGKTVLIIAHRLTTICEADRIIVLKEGRIEETGNHQQLLGRGGLYKSMWDAYTMSAHWQLERVPGREEGLST